MHVSSILTQRVYQLSEINSSRTSHAHFLSSHRLVLPLPVLNKSKAHNDGAQNTINQQPGYQTLCWR